jgi:RND superfamily putative drug exporter
LAWPDLGRFAGGGTRGLLALPGYKASYNDRAYISGSIPANVGFAAAERHFSQSRLLPDILMVESDHDMRNPTDFIVLNKIAKAIFKVPGVSRVQGITRPEGLIAHTSLPFMISLQTAGQEQFTHFLRARAADMLKQADDMTTMIKVNTRMYELMTQMTAINHRMTLKVHDMYDITYDLRNWLALFDDFFRPIRNYLYWEPHCFNIPVCWALRSIFDALDTTDELVDKTALLLKDIDKLDELLPQMNAIIPQQIEFLKKMRSMLLVQHSTMVGILGKQDGDTNTATLMAQALTPPRTTTRSFCHRKSLTMRTSSGR